jgi:hypothetical protein
MGHVGSLRVILPSLFFYPISTSLRGDLEGGREFPGEICRPEMNGMDGMDGMSLYFQLTVNLGSWHLEKEQVYDLRQETRKLPQVPPAKWLAPLGPSNPNVLFRIDQSFPITRFISINYGHKRREGDSNPR